MHGQVLAAGRLVLLLEWVLRGGQTLLLLLPEQLVQRIGAQQEVDLDGCKETKREEVDKGGNRILSKGH